MLQFFGFKLKYRKGTKVEALSPSTDKWKATVIKEDLGNGHYKIQFEDGGEILVDGRSIRDYKPPKPDPLQSSERMSLSTITTSTKQKQKEYGWSF